MFRVVIKPSLRNRVSGTCSPLSDINVNKTNKTSCKILCTYSFSECQSRHNENKTFYEKHLLETSTLKWDDNAKGQKSHNFSPKEQEYHFVCWTGRQIPWVPFTMSKKMQKKLLVVTELFSIAVNDYGAKKPVHHSRCSL